MKPFGVMSDKRLSQRDRANLIADLNQEMGVEKKIIWTGMRNKRRETGGPLRGPPPRDYIPNRDS